MEKVADDLKKDKDDHIDRLMLQIESLSKENHTLKTELAYDAGKSFFAANSKNI